MFDGFFAQAPKHLFFTGKGGVGKTALSCAVAIGLADRGKRVLLVSTDPASNLDEMLGVGLTSAPTPVPGLARLSALNIDPERAAELYRQRVLAPYDPSKHAAEIAKIREQLSGACTTEIAAFDQFAGLLAGDELGADFDHVIFDTAPTGHTIRLLQLPRAWTSFLSTASHDASCLGPHSGLTMRFERFSRALAALTDPARSEIVLVARANAAALKEAGRTSAELAALDIRRQLLVINGVFHPSDPGDPLAAAIAEKESVALAELPAALRDLPRYEVPLRSFNLVGLGLLRALLSPEDLGADPPPPVRLPAGLAPLSALAEAIAADGQGLVMVMGKGGVGKTTIAAALAVELASRQAGAARVKLSTTDPAAHLSDAMAEGLPNISVSRIDPQVESKAYVARVLKRKGQGLSAEARALLEEDLKSPCTEEVAVFHAFSHLIGEARSGFVILDTAPTGHTLLLLDATGAYHRDVLRGMSGAPGKVTTPLMRLQDPGYTKVVIVTLAETTPVSEAAHLQADLRRAGVEPYAWVINSSLAAAELRDPLLLRRAAAEVAQIERVLRDHARRVYIVPRAAQDPVGPARLHALAT